MCALEQIIMSAPMLSAVASQVAVEASPFIDGAKEIAQRASKPLMNLFVATDGAFSPVRRC